MQEVVVLEWFYSPNDYFEEPIRIVHDQYEMIIDGGKIEARIKPEYYDKEHKMREELHNALNYRFISAQIISHKLFELSKPSMYRLHPDGKRDVTVFLEPIVVTVSVRPLDVIIKDKEGNIISNTRRERIEKKKELADLVEKHRSRDPLVVTILNSFKAAMNDPDNELVHLYEIRDALCKNFGTEATTRKALGVSGKAWDRLGQLANYEPLKQGRHRGKNVGVLRNATEGELKEARTIVKDLIKSYLKCL